MKTCPKCKKEKTFSEFCKNKNRKDGLQRICRICIAEQSRKSYLKNPTPYKNRVKQQIKKGMDYVDNYKKNNPCIKCNENRYWLLDFHHINSIEKDENLGTLRMTGCLNKIKKEMIKCVILCKNCHSDFHYLERHNNMDINKYISLGSTPTPATLLR
jgi:hypothetical protein